MQKWIRYLSVILLTGSVFLLFLSAAPPAINRHLCYNLFSRSYWGASSDDIFRLLKMEKTEWKQEKDHFAFTRFYTEDVKGDSARYRLYFLDNRFYALEADYYFKSPDDARNVFNQYDALFRKNYASPIEEKKGETALWQKTKTTGKFADSQVSLALTGQNEVKIRYKRLSLLVPRPLDIETVPWGIPLGEMQYRLGRSYWQTSVEAGVLRQYQESSQTDKNYKRYITGKYTKLYFFDDLSRLYRIRFSETSEKVPDKVTQDINRAFVNSERNLYNKKEDIIQYYTTLFGEPRLSENDGSTARWVWTVRPRSSFPDKVLDIQVLFSNGSDSSLLSVDWELKDF